MTTPFTIPHTAQEISDAVSQVVNADSTPQSPSTNMVTSEGVKSYVDGAVTGLTTANIAIGTLVKESDSIGSNDNDDTIPTSAAVKDYVDSNDLSGCRYLVKTLTDYNPPDTTLWELDMTEQYDPLNICTLDGGDRIQINGGTGAYLIGFSGEYRMSQGFASGTSRSNFTYRYEINGHVVHSDFHEGSSTSFRIISHTHIHYLSNNDVIRITGQGGGSYASQIRVSVRNAGVFIKKISL